jgi:uncharacterized protein
MAFVAGPRQVGKTTLARALLPVGERGYFNWDVDLHRRQILRDLGGFWQEAPAGSGGKPRIVLDEIHKYPRWKRFLKGLFDLHGSRLEILVTGSGRLDLYQKGGDSLLGRYDLYRLHPFTVGEFLARGRQSVLEPAALADILRAPEEPPGAAEVLDLVDRFSGFPEPLHAARLDRLRRWRRLRRQLVLREDLRDLTRIREIGLIDQLVSLIPDRVGSPLSLNALREELGVAFNTVKTWLGALERLYYVFELRPFAGRLARTLRREGKVYLFDHTEIESPGPRFENLVALHLLKLVDAWNDLGYGDFALKYLRDKEKREVDFLVTDRGRPFLLLEAKLSDASVSPSLVYFAERLRPQHVVQVVRTGPVRLAGGHYVLPAARLLAWL